MSLHLIPLSEILGNSPSLQEILWNFSCFKDERQCLTLSENPHFYTDLPTLPEAYDDRIEINSTDDFRHADIFYVLIDKPKPVLIKTNISRHFFSNFWYPHNVIIFKGLGAVFFPPVSDVFLDICGRLRGEGIVKASLDRTYCGFCKRLPVSQPTVPTIPRNPRELKQIITSGCSRMRWKCSIGCLSMHYSNTGLRVCIGQVASDIPVCYDAIITYLTASANINIVPGPLATNF